MRDKYLRYIPRQLGHTTMIAKAVKESKGVLICADQNQADQNRKRFDIATVSIHNLERLRVGPVPMVFDNHAVDMMNTEYEREISALQLTILKYGLGHSVNCTHIEGRSKGENWFCNCNRREVLEDIKKIVEKEMGGKIGVQDRENFNGSDIKGFKL